MIAPTCFGHKMHGTQHTPQLETLFTNIAEHLTTYFYFFTVHFDSLSFIHTNSCTFSYNYVSVF